MNLLQVTRRCNHEFIAANTALQQRFIAGNKALQP